MRKSWNQYFMEIAVKVSERATCDRLHVGCVLVRDKRILATGYNGALPKAVHCDDAGHLLQDGHCVRTLHAEASAICCAAKVGVSIDGATAYVTHQPCFSCYKLLVSAGVSEIYYLHGYANLNYPDRAELFKDQADRYPYMQQVAPIP